MTIEERANKLYCDADGYVKDLANDYMRLGYIKGATEQQRIDEDELHASMECEYMKALEKEKERFIKKACKAHCIVCAFYKTNCNGQDESCKDLVKFRKVTKKVMEE